MAPTYRIWIRSRTAAIKRCRAIEIVSTDTDARDTRRGGRRDACPTRIFGQIGGRNARLFDRMTGERPIGARLYVATA